MRCPNVVASAATPDVILALEARIHKRGNNGFRDHDSMCLEHRKRVASETAGWILGTRPRMTPSGRRAHQTEALSQSPKSADIRRRNLDAETFEADVMAFARRQQLDRTDAEILQNLRAEADFQPLIFAGTGLRMRLVRIA